jgi:hypothetical protein
MNELSVWDFALVNAGVSAVLMIGVTVLHLLEYLRRQV